MAKPIFDERERTYIEQVLESGILAQGPFTAKLEAMFAALCGVKHGIAVSSGTSALHLALLAYGIGPGDEVITTPFSFAATANAILYTGATPVFVDIEEETYCIDIEKIEEAITKRTKAILPVHLYGHPCRIKQLMGIAEKHHLIVIEDAAQAIGAKEDDAVAGSFSTACFSLYATKNVTSGEGGMITTNDDAVANQCRLLRNHGMRVRNEHEILGYNMRMTDLCSAVGCAQMEKREELQVKRDANAAFFNANLRSVRTPRVRAGCTHVWHQYVIRIDGDRDKAAEILLERGIQTAVFYPKPIYAQPHIRQAMTKVPHLPVVELVTKEVLAIPVHPALSEADRERILDAVNSL